MGEGIKILCIKDLVRSSTNDFREEEREPLNLLRLMGMMAYIYRVYCMTGANLSEPCHLGL